MAKQATIEIEVETEEQGNGVQSVVVDNVHKLFLVGLGAAAMAQDEIINLIDKLVEHGENTEKKARESISGIVEDRKQNVKQNVTDVNKRAEKEMNARMESALNRFNIPSRVEIKSLDRKITRLSKKIDDLNKQVAA
jgi:poly(hydroxyalkanoate) granule-associated protein